MANIMDFKSVSNNVHRAGFDLSSRMCFTAKVGEMIPVKHWDLLPGDFFKMDGKSFMRTLPVQKATFGRVREYYDFYFVPYNLLWDKFESWIVQTKNAYHAKSNLTAADNFTTSPYFTDRDIVGAYSTMGSKEAQAYLDYWHTGSDKAKYAQGDMSKLLTYLGYPITLAPTGVSDVALNPFPLLAYHKIYQDYFRFSQWEDAAPWTYNLDYILSEDKLHMDIAGMMSGRTANTPTIFTLHHVNFDKDLVNGMLPQPQYGDVAIAGPLTGDFSGLRAVWSSSGNSKTMKFQVASHQSGHEFFPLGYDATSTTTGSSVNPDTIRLNGLNSSPIAATLNNLYPSTQLNFPVSGSGMSIGLSILVLRQAEALQKWKEITLSGDSDYKEQISKHWNVPSSQYNSYRCQYLGGFARNLDVSEVINTNLQGEEGVADIAGRGLSASNGKINFKNHDLYGLIMCIYHAKPIVEWNSMNILHPCLTKVKATDYAIPEFDSIGMQPLLRLNIMYNGNSPTVPAGYVPRYAEYKTDLDLYKGSFATTNVNWVLPHTLASVAQTQTPLTYRAYKVPPSICDNMFVAKADNTVASDQLLNTIYFDVKAVRNLSRDGMPY
mgnify:CR=1 FL=1|jgi:hypothetical protein|nr:MAG TPA: Major capsid protein [Microviridae sp.]